MKYWKRLSVFMLAFAILLYNRTEFSFGSVGFDQSQKEENVMGLRAKRAGSRLNKAEILKIAQREVAKRGFKTSEYEFEIKKKGRFWKVECYPVQNQPGFIIMGGGIVIVLREDGTIVRVIRTQ